MSLSKYVALIFSTEGGSFMIKIDFILTKLVFDKIIFKLKVTLGCGCWWVKRMTSRAICTGLLFCRSQQWLHHNLLSLAVAMAYTAFLSPNFIRRILYVPLQSVSPPGSYPTETEASKYKLSYEVAGW